MRPMTKEEEEAALRRKEAFDEKERDKPKVSRSDVDMATPIDILENSMKK